MSEGDLRHRNNLQIRHATSLCYSGRQNGSDATKNTALNAAQSAQRREDIRLTKMMLTIFLCFLVCFLPLMLVNVADDDVQFPFLHIVASVLAWASAVVNPFIYAFKNRQYQQAFIKVILLIPRITIPRIGPGTHLDLDLLSIFEI